MYFKVDAFVLFSWIIAKNYQDQKRSISNFKEFHILFYIGKINL